MEYIAAPWREAYVKKVCRKEGCVLCRALQLKNDRAAFILFRGKWNFIILNKFPYNLGHLMIAPCRHLADFEKARPEEGAEMAELLQVALRVLGACYKPHGFNTGMNLGRSAGAGVAGHYHLHVIPRWTGDSNFMPLVADTKVFIEDLDTTYQRLRPLFDKERARRERAGRK
jgi:ATP adenylyltransferase